MPEKVEAFDSFLGDRVDYRRGPLDFSPSSRVSCIPVTLLVLLTMLTLILPPAALADEPDSFKELAKAILTEAKKQKKQSLGVMDFADLNGRVTPLGQFVAEELSAALAMAGTVSVVDRSQINRLLQEQGVSGLRSLDPGTARKIGKAAGVDALVSGSLMESGKGLRITAKVIDTETVRLIAATQKTIPITSLIAELLKKQATDIEKSKQTEQASPSKRPAAQSAPSQPPAGMVLIPAGSFLYGESGKEQKIFLPAFWIDYYEVTNDDYNRVRDIVYAPDKANFPVSDVSWKNAFVYCELLGKRLPTEQEWEKAARGTDGRLYPWGNVYDPKKVNAGSRLGGAAAVGQFNGGASPYGLFDMAGNVSEWTGSEEDGAKIYRGGSWASSPLDVRTMAHSKLNENFKLLDLGLRCAKDGPR